MPRGTPVNADALAARLAGRLDYLAALPQHLHFPADAPGLNYKASATTKATVDVPDGTAGITIITGSGFTSLTLVGHTSRFPYLPVGNLPYVAAQMFTIPWSNPPDDQADITIITGAGQSGTLFGVASQVPGISYVNQPWLVPNKRPFSSGFVAGADQLAIAGVAGQSIYIFGMNIVVVTVGAAGSLVFVSDGAGGASFNRAAGAQLGPTYIDAHGAPLTAGNGLFITVPAGAVAELSVAYSQA